MSGDAELLERWQAGDEASARDLLERYFPILYRFFRNKIDGDVGDLIQQTLFACSRYRGEIHTSFRAWILTIARHELYRELRKRQRRLGGEDFDASVHCVVDSATSPFSAAAKAQQGRLLLRALRHLPAELQVVLELHYWEDLSTKEMCEVLEIPQGTVKSRIRRAREQLEVALRSLAENPGEAETTIAGLETWARELRGQLGDAGGEPVSAADSVAG